MRDRLQGITRNTLFMNAFYLMLASFVVAALGFVFWVIITKSYPSATVGIAATLLSVSGLLSMLSLAGFDTAFVRFLPKSKRWNDHVNSGLLVVALISTALSLGFVLLLPYISPNLAPVLHNHWHGLAFIFFTVVTSLNVLTNAVFLARKRSRDIFFINLAFSLVKLVLPLLVVGGDAMTIFALTGISQLVGLFLSIIMMKRRCGYVFSPRVHMDILHLTKKYSFSVYLSSILNLLPPTILPLVVIQQLGAESAAYYYIVFTIASVLYTIAYATMQSAFAESSHAESDIKLHIAKAAKFTAALLLPAGAVIFILSGSILEIFGSEYARGGSELLRLFAVSALGVAASSAMGAVFKVTHNLKGVVIMNIVYAATIIGLSYALVQPLGINGVGWAWAAGTVSSAAVGFMFLLLDKTLKEIHQYGTAS